jgi:excinuclease ABC subunit B
MQRAMDETERRRNKQLAFNKAHGITPKGIQKPITDILEGAYGAVAARSKGRKAAEPEAAYNVKLSDPKAVAARLKQLESEMVAKARNLEFEEAAKIRDEMKKLRELTLSVGGVMERDDGLGVA